MCGIVGIMYTDKPVDSTLLHRMNHLLTHRGPDDEGYFIEEGIGLGMRRLSIIDLGGGKQPMFNEDNSVVVVFNGEIYNYKDLRIILEDRGHVFKTQSDTEVIVHGYEEWGAELPTHLNGMFAYALYDRKNRKLLVARDHLGIKPLYYAPLKEGGMAFASELKALRKIEGWSQGINLVALDEFLAMRYIPSPLTIYEGAYKLPPGHQIVFSDGRMKIDAFWSIDLATRSSISFNEAVEITKALVTDSVRRQMFADVPVGVLLSGGLDSSVIASLMAELTNKPIRSFTATFPGWPSLNESLFARQVADYLGLDHKEITIDTDIDISDAFVKTVKIFDEPFADYSALPMRLIAQEASSYLRVVLTGDGSDELFAGYPHYCWYNPYIGMLFSFLKSPFKKILWGRRGFRFVSTVLSRDVQEAYFDGILILSHLDRELRANLLRVFDGKIPKAHVYPNLSDVFSDQLHPTTLMRYWDVKIWLNGDPLVKVDTVTMAASLEARVPFLDHRLVDFVFSLPAHFHRSKGFGKSLLRAAFSSKLPILTAKRSKQPFEVPVHDWLRGPLKPLLTEALLGNQFSWFREDVLKKWIDLHLSGRRLGRTLWTLLSFAIWYEEVYKASEDIAIV